MGSLCLMPFPYYLIVRKRPQKLFRFTTQPVSYLKQESALAVSFQALPMRTQKTWKSHSMTLLENVRRHIQVNFYRKIDFKNLARQCFMCQKHFIRRFKEAYGLSPRAYQTDIRLKEAQTLLKSGMMNVRETGETIGFADPMGFQRLFKKHAGMSPGVFKEIISPSSSTLFASSPHGPSPDGSRRGRSRKKPPVRLFHPNAGSAAPLRRPGRRFP